MIHTSTYKVFVSEDGKLDKDRYFTIWANGDVDANNTAHKMVEKLSKANGGHKWQIVDVKRHKPLVISTEVIGVMLRAMRSADKKERDEFAAGLKTPPAGQEEDIFAERFF